MLFASPGWLTAQEQALKTAGVEIGTSFGGPSTAASFISGALGDRVTLVARRGEDETGNGAVRHLQRVGVDTSAMLLTPEQPTDMNLIRNREVSADVWEKDYALSIAAADYSRSEALQRLRPGDLVHLGGMELVLCPDAEKPARYQKAIDEMVGVARIAKAKGATVVADFCMGDPKFWAMVPDEFFPMVDVAKPGLDQAQGIYNSRHSRRGQLKLKVSDSGLLSHQAELTKLMDYLLELGFGAVFMTMDINGTLIAAKKESVFGEVRLHHIPIIPARKFKDGTGCGDAFVSGIIHGMLRRWNMHETAQFCATIGSLIAEVIGVSLDTQYKGQGKWLSVVEKRLTEARGFFTDCHCPFCARKAGFGGTPNPDATIVCRQNCFLRLLAKKNGGLFQREGVFGLLVCAGLDIERTRNIDGKVIPVARGKEVLFNDFLDALEAVNNDPELRLTTEGIYFYRNGEDNWHATDNIDEVPSGEDSFTYDELIRRRQDLIRPADYIGFKLPAWQGAHRKHFPPAGQAPKWVKVLPRIGWPITMPDGTRLDRTDLLIPENPRNPKVTPEQVAELALFHPCNRYFVVETKAQMAWLQDLVARVIDERLKGEQKVVQNATGATNEEWKKHAGFNEPGPLGLHFPMDPEGDWVLWLDDYWFPKGLLAKLKQLIGYSPSYYRNHTSSFIVPRGFPLERVISPRLDVDISGYERAGMDEYEANAVGAYLVAEQFNQDIRLRIGPQAIPLALQHQGIGPDGHIAFNNNWLALLYTDPRSGRIFLRGLLRAGFARNELNEIAKFLDARIKHENRVLFNWYRLYGDLHKCLLRPVHAVPIPFTIKVNNFWDFLKQGELPIHPKLLNWIYSRELWTFEDFLLFFADPYAGSAGRKPLDPEEVEKYFGSLQGLYKEIMRVLGLIERVPDYGITWGTLTSVEQGVGMADVVANGKRKIWAATQSAFGRPSAECTSSLGQAQNRCLIITREIFETLPDYFRRYFFEVNFDGVPSSQWEKYGEKQTKAEWERRGYNRIDVSRVEPAPARASGSIGSIGDWSQNGSSREEVEEKIKQCTAAADAAEGLEIILQGEIELDDILSGNAGVLGDKIDGGISKAAKNLGIMRQKLIQLLQQRGVHFARAPNGWGDFGAAIGLRRNNEPVIILPPNVLPKKIAHEIQAILIDKLTHEENEAIDEARGDREQLTRKLPGLLLRIAISLTNAKESIWGEIRDFRAQEFTRRSFALPAPFPQGLHGRGADWPEWLVSSLIASAILSLSLQCGVEIPVAKVIEQASQLCQDHRLRVEPSALYYFLNGLRQRGLIVTAHGVEISEASPLSIYCDLNPRALALWADDAGYIYEDIVSAKRESKKKFLAAIDDYATIIDNWWAPSEGRAGLNLYPLEAKYPVLRALALLEQNEQDEIVTWLINRSEWQRRPLIDAILLMLDYEASKSRGWLTYQAPQMNRRSIYEVAAEVSLLAGGLGRVEQYHGRAMSDLGADVSFIEPAYRFFRDKEGAVRKLDYTRLPIPVKRWEKLDAYFMTIVGGREVEFEVYTGLISDRMRTFLIRDKGEDGNGRGKYVNILYEFGTPDSPASAFDFTEFFTKAALELIRYLELQKKKEEGDAYLAPLVNCNDGQALPMAAWRRIFYADINRLQNGQIDKDTWEIFAKAVFCGATHTYKNRLYTDDYDWGLRFLKKAGVPDKWLWVFLRDVFGRKFWDLTSAGLRCADVSKAVSMLQAYEMNALDPGIKLFGISNGDDRGYSGEFFHNDLIRARAVDVECPRPQEFALAKKAAKENAKERLHEQGIELDPEKMVISCSGRLVDEKAGRHRALTNENIKAWVKAGIQVVVFGNIQPGDNTSKAIAWDLHLLQESIVGAGYPGKFFFRSKFNIIEQRALLAATDIQIQDSHRYSEAAGFTESDIAVNGGLQLAPPYWEGMLQRQGRAINWKTLQGNTLIPPGARPEDYRDLILFAHKEFQEGNLAVLQAQSRKLSRVLSAALTATEQLRLWNSAIYSGLRKPPQERACGEVAIEEVAVQYYVGDGQRQLPEASGVFSLPTGSLNAANEHVPEFVVTVNRNLSGNPAEVIPFDLISAVLVSEWGVRIPLCLEQSSGNRIRLYTRIPTDLPMPFNGAVEVTSGIWKITRGVKINVEQKVAQEVSEAAAEAPRVGGPQRPLSALDAFMLGDAMANLTGVAHWVLWISVAGIAAYLLFRLSVKLLRRALAIFGRGEPVNAEDLLSYLLKTLINLLFTHPKTFLAIVCLILAYPAGKALSHYRALLARNRETQRQIANEAGSKFTELLLEDVEAYLQDTALDAQGQLIPFIQHIAYFRGEQENLSVGRATRSIYKAIKEDLWITITSLIKRPAPDFIFAAQLILRFPDKGLIALLLEEYHRAVLEANQGIPGEISPTAESLALFRQNNEPYEAWALLEVLARYQRGLGGLERAQSIRLCAEIRLSIVKSALEKIRGLLETSGDVLESGSKIVEEYARIGELLKLDYEVLKYKIETGSIGGKELFRLLGVKDAQEAVELDEESFGEKKKAAREEVKKLQKLGDFFMSAPPLKYALLWYFLIPENPLFVDVGLLEIRLFNAMGKAQHAALTKELQDFRGQEGLAPQIKENLTAEQLAIIRKRAETLLRQVSPAQGDPPAPAGRIQLNIWAMFLAASLAAFIAALVFCLSAGAAVQPEALAAAGCMLGMGNMVTDSGVPVGGSMGSHGPLGERPLAPRDSLFNAEIRDDEKELSDELMLKVEFGKDGKISNKDNLIKIISKQLSAKGISGPEARAACRMENLDAALQELSRKFQYDFETYMRSNFSLTFTAGKGEKKLGRTLNEEGANSRWASLTRAPPEDLDWQKLIFLNDLDELRHLLSLRMISAGLPATGLGAADDHAFIYRYTLADSRLSASWRKVLENYSVYGVSLAGAEAEASGLGEQKLLRFCGEFKMAADDSWRVVLPNTYLEKILGMHGFTMKDFEKGLNKGKGIKLYLSTSFDGKLKLIQVFLSSDQQDKIAGYPKQGESEAETTIDNNGRLKIPQELAELVGIRQGGGVQLRPARQRQYFEIRALDNGVKTAGKTGRKTGRKTGPFLFLALAGLILFSAQSSWAGEAAGQLAAGGAPLALGMCIVDTRIAASPFGAPGRRRSDKKESKWAIFARFVDKLNNLDFEI
ncbi:MAG: PfkB family carbohydrate kinase, partial [Candidatus Omnitrophota bacterium]|nr:PfkB family carbohydrate kinase [Candidatus Omnitrophota bacterium]